MKKSTKKGFTLVELVIVIAVIAILSAILIPTFGNVISDANEKSAMMGVKNAISQYTTTQAQAGSASDIGDGYFYYFKKGKTSGDEDLTPAKADYIFSFKGGELAVVYSTDADYTTATGKEIGELTATPVDGSTDVYTIANEDHKTLCLDAKVTAAGTPATYTVSGTIWYVAD